jgi:hypothetical protein
MNVDLLVIRDCPIAFLGVLTPGMGEEACADGLPDAGVVLVCEDATGEDGELETIHDCYQLLSHILSSLEGSSLHEVLKTPCVGETLGLPSLVNGQKGEMISVRVVEFRPFLVCQMLFLSRSIENILDREHGDYCHDFIRTS